jgi:RNA polymerase sigma-70 factor, ECF subfamily
MVHRRRFDAARSEHGSERVCPRSRSQLWRRGSERSILAMTQLHRDRRELSLDTGDSSVLRSSLDAERGVASATTSLEQRLEQTVRAHTPRLLAVARRLLGSADDAEDTVQEAFALALAALDGFEERSQLSTWLHRITVNVALSKLRARRRNLEQLSADPLPANAAEDAQAHPEEASAFSMEELIERREDGELLLACIEQLPEQYRRVIVLRDVEELDTRSVAQMLGVTDGVVKVRLHRARQALRVRMLPQLAEREAS